MSLNWKEIELIIKEEDITGSKIQAVVQNNFHAITWDMYSTQRGRFSYYTEVGTDQSRLHILDSKPFEKTKKLQRFIQFARKNIEGAVITSVRQLPFDRCVVWNLDNHGRKLKVYIRLYSGPGANILVTDEDDNILDLLLRRPGRDEISGEKLVVEERKEEGKTFEVRPYEGNFNSFIEKSCNEKQSDDTCETLRKQVEVRKEHELSRIRASIKSAERTIEENRSFERFKKEADLLSAYVHKVKKGDSSVTVLDWEDNKEVTLFLDKKLSPGENVQSYFDKYHKAQGAFDNAKAELERLNQEFEDTKAMFDRALEETNDILDDIKRLRKILDRTSAPVQVDNGPGIRCTSGGFEILVGRNAKENDDLLRHHARSMDTWIHTRDFPGGYVFIRYRRDKTVPLDVLLDGANLAVLFSKARDSNKVDLYYTQVKYLRRVKDGKTGLVIPTQEKNLTITPDKARIERLVGQNKK